MMEDDRTPPARPAGFAPRDLAALSVAEMRTYIVQLEAEIDRTRAMITQRESVRGSAEAVFGPRRSG
jgi:uncharacterized small protein (DUF1192 family)